MASEREEILKRSTPLQIRQYESPEGLDTREALVVAAFSNAVRQIAVAYNAQRGIDLYPPRSRVSDRTILEQGQSDPEILSPYTTVVLASGHLVAVPYSQNPDLRPHLEAASRHLEEGASITHDPDLADFARERARALLNNKYEASEMLWIHLPDSSNFGLLAGFYDRYDDKRLGIKFGASGWVTAKDRDASTSHQRVVNEIVRAYAESGLYAFPIQNPGVKISIEDPIIIGGLPARIELTANSLPCQQEWREKHGNKIVVLNKPFVEKFYNKRLPMVKRLVAQTNRSRDEKQLMDANGFLFDSHEASHVLIRRPNDEARFGRDYTMINELGATVIGLSLLPETAVRKKALDDVLAVQFAVTATEYRDYLDEVKSGKEPTRENYLTGDAIILNYLLQSGVVSTSEKGELYWEDTMAVYSKLREFAVKLEGVITGGGSTACIKLRGDYGSLEPIGNLAPFRDLPFYQLESY